MEKNWSLSLPPKIKIFVWKMAHDIIATEANLVRHHVLGDPRCVLCGYYWANTTHSPFFYQASKKGWKDLERWPFLKKFKEFDSINILHAMENHLNREDFEKFCSRGWGIWKDRCALFHNHKRTVGNTHEDSFGKWMDNYLFKF